MSHEIPKSNPEREYDRVDLLSSEWTERLADAPVYRKTALVHIRPAVPGELVVTQLANGQEETTNVAGEETVVITNPGGEKQVVSLEKAVMRYDPTDTPGLFLAKGMVRAIDNPYEHPISIVAPWGEVQYGDVECKIVALYDPSNPDTVDTDRYIIGKDEFNETYGDYPMGVSEENATTPVASSRVLDAMEAYNVRSNEATPEMRVHLGAISLAM